MKRQVRHLPVLLNEVMHCLDLRAGNVVVDCTLGLGGHSAAMLQAVGLGGHLLAFDFDSANIARARERLDAVGSNYTLQHGNYAGIDKVLGQLGIAQVDAILADVGVASPQIDDPARGFSYKQPGPLDMRMDPTRGEPAAVLVNRMTQKQLADAILELGDETDADYIAELIVQERTKSPITTTDRLMEIVCAARNFTIERAAGAKLHPAARTFQALRMLVNRELPNLQRLMDVAPAVLKPGGRLGIISFHSGEDRIVKRAFRDGLRSGIYAEISDEAIVATEEEIKANPRSRSAKLRWGIRAGDEQA